ncbi:hypothetical protein MRB53_030537 [Persea americana]|uniref:Uncharacterized protein n=1 Tax=Persea americana TaxID=3435 RepID=A0ACC2KLV3_PERAE|nr:hypothetical protein MRB53_030537 [Persea americana]
MKFGRSSKQSRPLNSEGKPRDNSASSNSRKRLKPSKRSLKRQKPPLPLHKGQQRNLFPRPQEWQENSPSVISCHHDSKMRLCRGHHTLPQGSWSDDDEDQKVVQENVVNPALANALVDPNEVEPQGADEEEDLAPMPDLEEYARILQRLAIEQEQDRINQLHQNPEPEVPENLQASPPATPKNEESCWIDDPLTSEDESDSQQSIVEASSIEVISTEIASSQSSSPETVTSEFKPLPTYHHEEALADEDLFPEDAPCNAITEDGNAAAKALLANQEDQPPEPEEGLPKEEPPLEAFEVGRGTRFGRDYHKNYNQPSSSYVNPSGKQVVNAPSGNDNENARPKEAFKYDLIEHFKHIPACLHNRDLLRMSPQTSDSLISELERLIVDVDKHAPQVLQIEMDYRVKKSKASLKGEKKETKGSCTECLSVQKAASATITFNKEDLLLELGIPPSKLSHTSVSIFGYGGTAQRPIGKIRFKLQIGDLISEVTVYAIKTPSCYNILLGRPWIHENGVIPSTLHQCIKFVGDDGLRHLVFADKKPFKSKEVHFVDLQMYRDEKEEKEEKIASFAGNLQKDKGKAPQQSSEENKPSGEPKESNQSPFVISFKSSKPLVITTKAKKTKQKTGGKFIISFVSIIQDTDLDSETEDDTSSSQADTQQVQPILTPLETPADIENPVSATFIFPATMAEEKPIFFHRSNASSSNTLLEPFQNEGMPQLSLYSLMAQAIMKKMGYDAQNPIGFGGGRAPTSRVDEDIDLPGYLFEELPDKDPGSSSNWYDFSNDEKELSNDTDAWFSDLEEPSSPKEVPYFDRVSARNPEGIVQLEVSENIVEEPPSNLPTKDYIQKIDLGTPDNPRPVFIRKNIKDDELPEYVSFLREFVDCFAWSYAEMPGLDPKIAVHKLNLQENVKPVKQGQRRFHPDVMDKIEQEFQKLKNVASSARNSILNGWPTSSP